MVTYRELFEVREFRYLYGGQLQSYLGDRLAAVAISVVVFDRTGSGLLTAVAYASAWLPALAGGPLLATYADRLPRRAVMIFCDCVRAVLVAVLAIPAVPLWAAVALLYVANLFATPFMAARAALMPEILAGDAYVTGNGLGHITTQVNQIAGFAVGGVAVMAIGPVAALLIDSGTFGVSAVLIGMGLARRPAPVAAARARLLADTWAGMRYIFGDPWLRGCLLLVWLASAFAFAPGAIAYPYARHLGGGPDEAGLLLAVPGVGCTVGALVFTRILRPRVRDRLLVPAAVLATAALLPVLFAPPLPVVLCLLAAGGSGAAFAVPLNAIFVRRVAPGFRARATGVAMSGLLAAQGLGFLLAGAAVQAGLAPPAVVGLCGAVGAPLVLVTGLTWRRGPTAARVVAPAGIGEDAAI